VAENFSKVTQRVQFSGIQGCENHVTVTVKPLGENNGDDVEENCVQKECEDAEFGQICKEVPCWLFLLLGARYLLNRRLWFIGFNHSMLLN
jgi:hypothetical protein